MASRYAYQLRPTLTPLVSELALVRLFCYLYFTFKDLTRPIQKLLDKAIKAVLVVFVFTNPVLVTIYIICTKYLKKKKVKIEMDSPVDAV